MKKKIYLLLMATLTMGMQTYAESYGIKVGGVDVTSDNCTAIEKAIPSDRIRANISGDDYWITYDNSTKTLTFYNVDIRRSGKDNRAILNDGCVGLKIVLRGENFFYAKDSSPVRLNRNTTITSECVSLDKRMPFTEIVGYNEDALTVGNGAYVTMDHAYLKIYAATSDALDGIDSPTLSIKNSWIEATGHDGHYAMCDYKELTIENSYVVLNSDKGTKAVQNLEKYYNKEEATATFNSSSKTFVNSASTPVAKVEIERQIPITVTYFSDANFRNYILKNWEGGADGKASYRECMNTDMLNVSNLEISSLEGIEHFANLQKLLCNNNKLTSLYDIHDLPFITDLYCDNNFLSSLNIGKKPYLTTISCNNNRLSAVSLDSSPKLTTLSFNNNELIWLDVTNNTNLVDLSVHHNNLKSLDVSKNTNLVDLSVNNNQLTAIDVSKNTNLVTLNVEYNNLTSLDVTKNTKLENFICRLNNLTSLDVSKNTSLKTLGCSSNELTSLDVTKNVNLVTLNVEYNNLTSLDVTKNTNLKSLGCSKNQLTSLDVTNNTKLVDLSVGFNNLTALDVTKCTNLEELSVGSNNLTSLDLSKNTNLKSLGCSKNQLTSLDLSKNTELTEVLCFENQLASIDLTNSTKLTVLNCYGNQLTSLDLTNSTKLTELNCHTNQLTSLNLSKNTNLKNFACSNNQLTSLDLSKCTELEYLWAEQNKLTSITLPASVPNLYQVVCFKNLIKTEQMQNIVNRLPTRTAAKPGILKPIAPDDAAEGNVITTQQVQTAQTKYWNVTDTNNQPYEGSSNTAIVTVEADQPATNAPRYNLGGQRVNSSYRGIVIQNGRKKVVK